MKKMGWWASDTATLNLRLPRSVENLIGEKPGFSSHHA